MSKPHSTLFLFLRKASALLQILLLCLLTTLPVWRELDSTAQDELVTQQPSSTVPDEDEIPTPFGNSTEESTTSGPSLAEEFTHDSDDCFNVISSVESAFPVSSSNTYTAFHGEQLIPPPDRF